MSYTQAVQETATPLRTIRGRRAELLLAIEELLATAATRAHSA
ncbi:hypothetical protein [Streptomyces gardneri]